MKTLKFLFVFGMLFISINATAQFESYKELTVAVNSNHFVSASTGSPFSPVAITIENTTDGEISLGFVNRGFVDTTDVRAIAPGDLYIFQNRKTPSIWLKGASSGNVKIRIDYGNGFPFWKSSSGGIDIDTNRLVILGKENTSPDSRTSIFLNKLESGISIGEWNFEEEYQYPNEVYRGSFAFGYDNTVMEITTGDGFYPSFVVGGNNDVRGDNSIAMGSDNQLRGRSRITALGHSLRNLETSTFSQVLIGNFNEEFEKDHSIVFGTGNGSTSPRTIMTMHNDSINVNGRLIIKNEDDGFGREFSINENDIILGVKDASGLEINSDENFSNLIGSIVRIGDIHHNYEGMRIELNSGSAVSEFYVGESEFYGSVNINGSLTVDGSPIGGALPDTVDKFVTFSEGITVIDSISFGNNVNHEMNIFSTINDLRLQAVNHLEDHRAFLSLAYEDGIVLGMLNESLQHTPTRLIMANNQMDLGEPGENKLSIRIRNTSVPQLFFLGLPIYDSEAAATAAGIVQQGQIYKTSTGELRIKL